MALAGELALGAAKSYTEETVEGAGAVKGKNCTISSITEIEGGHRVTFKWYLDNGTEQTSTMDVMDGQGGGGTGDYADLTNKPSINSVTLSGNKTTSDLSISYNDLSNKPTIPSITNCYQTTDETASVIDDADTVPYYNTSESAKNKVTWSNIKGNLKSYFDTIYSQVGFSETEQDTGLTWIDGSHIYQKTVSCGALPSSATTKSVSHGITNMNLIISVKGLAYASNDMAATQLQIPNINPNTTNASMGVAVDTSKIYIYVGKDRSAFDTSYITVQYTKSTT